MEIPSTENKVQRRKLSKPVLTEDECFEKYGKQDYKGKSFYEKVKVTANDMCGCNGKLVVSNFLFWSSSLKI